MEHHIKFHFNNVSKKFFSFNYQNLKTLMITTEFRIFLYKIGNNYPFYKITMTLDYNILYHYTLWIHLNSLGAIFVDHGILVIGRDVIL